MALQCCKENLILRSGLYYHFVVLAVVIKGHSFRIGAATSTVLRDESDAQIRAASRWASDAFRKYIRIA